MKIQIEEVLDAADGRVRFRSGAESAKGRWAGPGEAPIGRELEIEMEIFEEDIISARPAIENSLSLVRQDGVEVVIIGRVERVGHDGVIELRVGQDIVLLERIGVLSNAVEGANLELRVPELKIYPIDL